MSTMVCGKDRGITSPRIITISITMPMPQASQMDKLPSRDSLIMRGLIPLELCGGPPPHRRSISPTTKISNKLLGQWDDGDTGQQSRPRVRPTRLLSPITFLLEDGFLPFSLVPRKRGAERNGGVEWTPREPVTARRVGRLTCKAVPP